MTTTGPAGDLLTRVEHYLAWHRPFGDHRYIDGRTSVHYERRLEMLAEYVATAGDMLVAFRKARRYSRYRGLGDPVVRSAVNAALGYFKFGGPEVRIDETTAILTIAARHLGEARRLGPLAAGAPRAMRLGRASHHPWVWQDEREEDVPARAFRRLFETHLTDSARLGLRTPDEDEQRTLLKGTRLLDELLPNLAISALSHAHLVAVVTSPLGVVSVTNPSIPGAAFLAAPALKHPWRAAEFLLHEAVHLKFIDLEHTHSMLRRGYAAEESPRISAVWNRSQSDDSNEWPANRVLTVLHVYTCLALFFKAVELRAPEMEERYGSLHDLDPRRAARRALDRAYYLALNVQSVGHELGLGGQRFADWLFELLGALDPQPPSFQPKPHLLLDLYERETDQVAKAIGDARPAELRRTIGRPSFDGASLEQLIGALVESEVVTTERLLSDVCRGSSPFAGGSGGWHGLSPATESATPVEIATRFRAARSLISRSLRAIMAAAPPALHAERLLRVEQHVGTMLAHSATHVRAVNELVPRAEVDLRS